MRKLISLATLSAFAALCASANAYNVTFVSQTITRTVGSDLYSPTYASGSPLVHGATTSFTNSNSSRTATFGFDSQIYASSWADPFDPMQSGGATYQVGGWWTLKTKIRWSPSYQGETPSQNMLVKYDVKVKRHSFSYGNYPNKFVDGTGYVTSSGVAALNSTLYPGLESSVSIFLSYPVLDGEQSDTDGDTSYHDSGSDPLTGITFSYVNGEWIGEATSYLSQEAALSCGLAVSQPVIWPWESDTVMEIKYQYTPTMVGTETIS